MSTRRRTAQLAALLPDAAERDPDGLGVIGVDRQWTWSELEARTRSLAGFLIEGGVRPGDRVAVARPKSEESFEAVHGVLRAGGIVVPVDPLAPTETSRAILEDAAASAILGDQATIAKIDPWSIGHLRMGAVAATGAPDQRMTPWDQAASTAVRRQRLPRCRPDDPAYLIFTSGSTGTPKGILHTHHSAAAYAQLAAEVHGLDATDRVAAMCPIHFDMSTLELYAAPLAGAATVTMSEAQLRFPASLVERCQQAETSIWYAVPFQLQSMMDRGGLAGRVPDTLRSIIYAGEPYPVSALRELMDATPGVAITNAYGPAEVNVCTVHDVSRPPTSPVPIGRPWGDVAVRVVDADGRTCDDGAVGELWVCAETMMSGYWRRPDLTAAVTPWWNERRWYRTGDLVSKSGAGPLDFHGRLDHQVKIRGTRIELGAVEAVLSAAPGVRDAVVAPLLADQSTDRAASPPVDAGADSLVAVVVLAEDASLDPRALRRWCAERLPSVAVPQRIDSTRRLPTTSSGKVDRRTVRTDLLERKPGGAPASEQGLTPQARSEAIS